MPMVFSAHAGSLLALTGTPVNVLVSEARGRCGAAAVRLLRVHARRRAAADRHDRDRRPVRHEAAAASRRPLHAVRFQSLTRRTLVEQYGLARRSYRMRVRKTSPLVGQPSPRRPALPENCAWSPCRKATAAGSCAAGRWLKATTCWSPATPDGAAALGSAMHLAFRLEDAAADVAGRAVQPQRRPGRGDAAAALGDDRRGRSSPACSPRAATWWSWACSAGRSPAAGAGDAAGRRHLLIQGTGRRSTFT